VFFFFFRFEMKIYLYLRTVAIHLVSSVDTDRQNNQYGKNKCKGKESGEFPGHYWALGSLGMCLRGA